MLSLVEMQRRIKDFVLQPALAHEPAALQWPDSAIEIHRSTVLSGLVRTLTLTFPSVSKLLGTELFAAVAEDYAREYPPDNPILHQYGESFPGYLREDPRTAALAYLSDLARFDLAIDRTARGTARANSPPTAMGPATQMRVDGTLRCLQLEYPADLIRDALESGDPAMLDDIDLRPQARFFALWRNAAGTGVKALSAPAARFLTAVVAGCTAAEALQLAAELTSPEIAVELVRTEILPSSFIQLTDHR